MFRKSIIACTIALLLFFLAAHQVSGLLDQRIPPPHETDDGLVRVAQNPAAQAPLTNQELLLTPQTSGATNHEENKQLGYRMGVDLGWTGNWWSCLDGLVMRESGWNNLAQNRASTAYGIGQFLDSTWAGVGIAKTADPTRQIEAMLIYIENRYGGPCGAYAHSQRTGWY